MAPRLPPARKRVTSSGGSLIIPLDQSIVDELDLSEGAEVELRVEDGRLVIEPVRAKDPDPPLEAEARAERAKRIQESIRHVLETHEELFARLAK
jgi:antitoxin component of MazEF toxin-antitoxin module